MADARTERIERHAKCQSLDRDRSPRRGDGGELFLQRARRVVVAGYAVETPRLLLNSESARFPHGLAENGGVFVRKLQHWAYLTALKSNRIQRQCQGFF